MLINPDWIDIASRLGSATLAGMLVGYNRETRSQAAGLRTTTLVCVAACLAMLLANVLLHAQGPEPREFMRADVMRLPLGVLTGIGFIGAGAIVRREDAVLGVATAATLWLMTIVGLVFGAGEYVLGFVVTLTCFGLLCVFERADLMIRRRFRATLRISAEPARLSEDEVRTLLAAAGQNVVAWGVAYEGGESYDARVEIEWEGRTRDRARPPEFLAALSNRPGVRRIDWSPQTVST